MKIGDLISRIDTFVKLKPIGELGFIIGTVTQFDGEEDFYLTPVRTTNKITYMGAIVRNVQTALTIAKLVDNKVSYIFVDSEKKVSIENYGLDDAGNIEKALSKEVKFATLLSYKGNDLTVHAADALLRVLSPNLTGAKVAVIGVGNLGMKLALSLLERGNNVCLFSRDFNHASEVSNLLNRVKMRTTIARSTCASSFNEAFADADVVIATSNQKSKIGNEQVDLMSSETLGGTRLLLDVGKGCFKEEVLDGQQLVYRVDVEAELSSEIDNLIKRSIAMSILPQIEIGSLRFIKKGIVGKKGDYLVDNPTAPIEVIGKCDGQGNLEYVSDEESRELLNLFSKQP